MSTSRPGDVQAMEIQEVSIDEVIPYWRNPRRITEEAVNAVAESIRRYGYLQPIVVDDDMCIILGHTRYSALRRLGAERIDVGVAVGLTADRVKQLRVLDNRVAEFNRWDLDKLVEELGQLDADLMSAYFPEIIGTFEDDEPSKIEIYQDDPFAGEEGDEHVHASSNDQVEFVCPQCFHSWEQKVTRRQILSGKIEGK